MKTDHDGAPIEPHDICDPCGARTPDGPCQRDAGAGTPHEGRGTCCHHGGWLPTHRAKALLADVDALVAHHRHDLADAPFPGASAPLLHDGISDLLGRHQKRPDK